MSAVTERSVDLTGTQLITLDPREYVAAVYAPFRDRLDAAKAAVANIETVDVSNKDSMAVAIKHRATFRAIRVEAAKQQLGRKWLLHPSNHVRRLEKPTDGFNPRRTK